MTSEQFLRTVTVEPVSPELISVSLSAPSDAEAIRRLGALTTVYLGFRGEQLTLQSNVLVNGMQQRIEKLQDEIAAVSQRIEQLAGASTSSGSALSDAIAQRAYIQGEIDTLRQSVEDATLRNASVVASSRVIDPPATDAGGLKRRVVLTLASGLIGGAALGCGTVLFFAIISDRLRRRSDVAAALEVPVPVSVGRITPLGQRWLLLPYLRRLDSRRTDERHRLAHAIEMELPSPRQWGPLGVVCIDNADEVRFAVMTAATNLAAEGCSVAVIDLTSQGNIELEAASAMMDSTHRPTLLRPRGIPVLAASMADLRLVGEDDGTEPSLDHIDATLVVGDLDPSVGADYLLTWTDRVMIAVTAGRSSAEMVRTAADLVRTAGLELRIAALLHIERTDDSSGTAGFDRPIPAPIHPVDVQERLKAVGKSVEEKQAVNEEQAVALAVGEQAAELIGEEQIPDEERAVNEMDDQPVAIAEKRAANQLTDEELTAEELTLHGEIAANEEQGAIHEQQPGDKEQAADASAIEMAAAADPEHAAVEEQALVDQEQAVIEDQTPDQEKPAEEQAGLLEEQQLTDEKSAADASAIEMAAAADPEHAAVEEQALVDQEQAVIQDQTPDQEKPAEEQAGLLEEQQLTDEKSAADASAVEMAAAADPEHAAVEEQALVDQEQAVIQDQTPDQEKPAEEQAGLLEEQQLTDEKSAADASAVEMAAAADPEHAAVEEQALVDQEQAVIQDQTPDQEQPAEEQKPSEEQTPSEEQPADGRHVPEEEQVAVLKEQTDEEPTADDEQAAALEDKQTDEEPTADDEQAAALEDKPTDEEPTAGQSAGRGARGQPETRRRTTLTTSCPSKCG